MSIPIFRCSSPPTQSGFIRGFMVKNLKYVAKKPVRAASCMRVWRTRTCPFRARPRPSGLLSNATCVGSDGVSCLRQRTRRFAPLHRTHSPTQSETLPHTCQKSSDRRGKRTEGRTVHLNELQVLKKIPEGHQKILSSDAGLSLFSNAQILS